MSQLASTIDSSAYIAGLIALIILTAFATVAHTFGKTPPAPPHPGHIQQQ